MSRVIDKLNDEIHRHHWWPHFQARCPGWEVFFVAMAKDEIIDFRRRIMWLSARLPDPLFRWAHATGHVMDHPEGMSGPISDAEEEAADAVAVCFSAYSPPQPVSEVAEVG